MKNKILLLITVATLGLTTATMAQVPSYVPTNGLVGWWPFNGNANDESGNANNGTVNGATLTSDRNGNANSAYSFDGVSNYIKCLHAGPTGNPTITASFWLKANPTLVAGHIIGYGSNGGSGQNFRVYMCNGCFGGSCSDAISFDTYDNAYSVTTINNNIWDFYTVVYDSTLGNNTSIVKIYKNGISLVTVCSSVNISATNITSFIPITFGRYHGTVETGFYKGAIDDIGIWNRALTQQEITALYNGCQLSVSNQPTNQAININNTAQFIVGSSDTNATYQWQTNLGVGFQNLNNAGQYSGTAKDTLMVSNVSMSNNNQQFRCIINNGSCTDTSNIAVLSVNNNVGINELAQKNLFSVFPNPAKNTMHVKADHKLIGSVFTIYDNIGKAVKSGKLNAANTTIDLSNLSGGIYLFSVGENRKQTFKIIKE